MLTGAARDKKRNCAKRILVIANEGPLSYLLAAGSSSFAAILTNSARDSACIFRMTFPRWILTVTSLFPSSYAICLFSKA